jgi:hypothetical protein
MEGGRFMEMPRVPQYSVEKNIVPDNGQKKEKHVELTYEEAKNAYEAGKQLRDRIIEITQGDSDYCYDIFKEVHAVIFDQMNAEDISRHIMHRILMGTMINEGEIRSLIFNDLDMQIYSKFLVPASCARSKEEIGEIVKDLLEAHDAAYVVQ